MPNRRELLKGITLFALGGLPFKASASRSPLNDFSLATLTLENRDKRIATPSESYFTFGLALKKGDVPNGNVPIVTRADAGTQLPAQFDLRSSWPDGSLRWCEVSCVGPSLAPGSKLIINIKSIKGSYNNSSARTLSDVTANSDLKVVITNCTDFNGVPFAGGSFTADFNSASCIPGQLEQVKRGPVCDQWRAWMLFPGQSQLGVWFYVTQWTKQSDKTRGPLSHIAKVHNGYVNISNPTKYIYDASYKNGAATIRRFNSDKTFTVASTTSNTLTCVAHGRATCDPVTIANSGGELPDGLTAGTIYYVRVVDANTLTLHRSGTLAKNNPSNKVNITSKGTGTHLLEFRVFQPHHTEWWTCGTDARSDWTAGEATIFVAQDKKYLHSTGVLPPYDLSVLPSPSSPTPVNYTPFCTGDHAPDNTGVGGAEMRGWIPRWASMAFLAQNDAWATKARVNALAQTHYPVHFVNEASGRIPCLRGSSADGETGDYNGLGTSKPHTYFFIQDNSSGTRSRDTAAHSGGSGVMFAGTGWDWSHFPDAIHYEIVVSGGAHLIDAQMIYANYALMSLIAEQSTGFSGNNRIHRVDPRSKYHYGIVIKRPLSIREVAWRFRTLAFCAAMVPDDWAEKRYFDDIVELNAQHAVDYLATQTPPFTTTGVWGFRTDGVLSLWMHDWIIGAVAMAYKLHEHANLLTWLNHLVKFPVGMVAHFGCVFGVDSYNTVIASSPNSGSSYLNWDSLGMYLAAVGQNALLQANASTDTISVTKLHTMWANSIVNNTRIMWPAVNATGPADQTASIPEGITTYQWYYVINRREGAGTFQLAETLAGGAVDITSDGGPCQAVYKDLVCPSAEINFAGKPDTIADKYINISHAALAMAEAVGATGVTTARQAIEAKIIADFSIDNSWSMQETF